MAYKNKKFQEWDFDSEVTMVNYDSEERGIPYPSDFLIGLEIHIPLDVSKKLFCSCLKGKEVCEICRGEPGAHPTVVNSEAVRRYCQVNQLLKFNEDKEPLIFERKHYRYYDLPKGYQITSNREKSPFKGKGFFLLSDGSKVVFSTVSLEEDPASLKEGPFNMTPDFSRAGNPLLEAVTETCFNSMKMLKLFYREFEETLILNQLKTKNEPLRCDVNCSFRSRINMKDECISTKRVEIKNLNSLTKIVKSLFFEFHFQKKKGYLQKEEVTKRLIEKVWDETQFRTEKTRKKEKYFFLPERNLQEVTLEKNQELLDLSKIKKKCLEVFPQLSVKELEQLIIQGDIKYLEEDNFFNKIRDISVIRGLFLIKKYCKIGNKIKKIQEIFKNYEQSPVTRYTLKEIIIRDREDTFNWHNRIPLSIEEIKEEINKICNVGEKIKRIVEIEQLNTFPVIQFSLF